MLHLLRSQLIFYWVKFSGIHKRVVLIHYQSVATTACAISVRNWWDREDGTFACAAWGWSFC